MDAFVVSALKYRPNSFDQVVGQSAITTTLLNAIASNHLAQALLFCGPRGVGKTTCARILAKNINRQNSPKEDKEDKEDFAFNIFELDAASNNSVDDIRNLIDQVRIPPQSGKYKVYIIDEVHMLSQSAFNAFLKTLEEPPKHTIFILATTEKHKIIPTILSRCQIFEFKRITVADIKNHLQNIAENQGIIADDEALHIIAKKADGALRDALSIFDRMVSFCGNTLTTKLVTENLNILDHETFLNITDTILDSDIPRLLIQYDKILSRGFDGHHFICGLASHFRNLLFCLVPDTLPLIEVSQETQNKYQIQCKKTNQKWLLEALDLANQCDLNYKNSYNKQLLVELCLMQLASIDESSSIKKKKSTRIIPSKQFKNHPSNTVKTTSVSVTKPLVKIEKSTNTESLSTTQEIDNSAISDYSISSIKHRKKQELYAQQINNKNQKELPKDNFSQETLTKIWQSYAQQLENSKDMMLSSLLHIGMPKLLLDYKIQVLLPNEGSKKSFLAQQAKLLEYLYKELNNHSIQLKVEVTESSLENRHLFLPEEKYKKLEGINPKIALLRKTFGMRDIY